MLFFHSFFLTCGRCLKIACFRLFTKTKIDLQLSLWKITTIINNSMRMNSASYARSRTPTVSCPRVFLTGTVKFVTFAFLSNKRSWFLCNAVCLSLGFFFKSFFAWKGVPHIQLVTLRESCDSIFFFFFKL